MHFISNLVLVATLVLGSVSAAQAEPTQVKCSGSHGLNLVLNLDLHTKSKGVISGLDNSNEAVSLECTPFENGQIQWWECFSNADSEDSIKVTSWLSGGHISASFTSNSALETLNCKL